MAKIQHLICTLGTSLFYPNMTKLVEREASGGGLAPELVLLARFFLEKDWDSLASEMVRINPTERVLGAEVNSVNSLLEKGLLEENAGLSLVYSDTADGRNIMSVLSEYFPLKGFGPVRSRVVEGLQDQDPKRFRTLGLRNLAKAVCDEIRCFGGSSMESVGRVAINATGGYKAQIALAVLLGQSLGVSVYYQHEKFAEIIEFPPMPVAMDLELWMRNSGLFFSLSTVKDPVPADRFKEEWDERLEPLVERVPLSGRDFLELSPVGQVFHEAFRHRFAIQDKAWLPPSAKSKPGVSWKSKEGHMNQFVEAKRMLERLVKEVPFVTRCETFYFNPDLPETMRFKLVSGGIVGIWSDGTATIKFNVGTTAENALQLDAALSALNSWISGE